MSAGEQVGCSADTGACRMTWDETWQFKCDSLLLFISNYMQLLTVMEVVQVAHSIGQR